MSKKAHCDVKSYIDAAYPAYGEAIDGVCVAHALHGAVTVIVPPEKEQKRLAQQASEGTADAIASVRNVILANVLYDALKTGEDFRGGAGNRLSPSQHVEVSNVKSRGAVDILSEGKAISLTLDTGFVDATARGAAVWQASGAIAPTVDKPAKRKQRGPGARTGGSCATGAYEVADYASQSQRFAIGVAVENECASQLMTGKPLTAHCDNAYGLAAYVLANDTVTFYDRVLPNITHTPGDFYVLVEPHNTSHEYLLSDELISGWWKGSHVGSRGEIDAALTKASSGGHNAAIYSKRDEVIAAIAALRADLVAKLNSAGSNASSVVADAYAAVAATNTIGDVKKVWPQSLADHYRAMPKCKLVCDDMRYWLLCALTSVSTQAANTKSLPSLMGTLNDIFNVVGDVLHTRTDPKVCTQLLQSMIMPTKNIEEICIFVRSSLFMSIPLLPSDVDKLSTNSSIEKKPAFEETFFNIAKLQLVKHQRIASGPNKDAIVRMLRAIGVELSADQLRELASVQ